VRADLLLRRAVATACCACAIGAAAADAPAVPTPATPATPATHEIRDPHYGDTLFHFFQDHYFTSITTLMVSQRFERVGHHADEAEVLRGGMLLSYGMPREAGEIFAQLIERGAAPPVRDRAWFFLAKIRYQRGYLEEAAQAFARIEQPLPPALEDDRLLLGANLLMAGADYAGAAAALAAAGEKTPGRRYVRFNLGIALIRAGDPTRGIPILDELGRAGAENEEFRSLRDRANVALGFAALADNHPQAARTFLERVRLNGQQSNKALLGFGWAATSLKDPKLALVPWLELSQRGLGDSAALESQIAVPYAYAELGAYNQSLARYNVAIDAFERENTALDESIAAIRSGRLVDALLDKNPGDEMGWFFAIRDLPALPHPSHLSQVLAQHEFQEAFKNYRDLRFLAGNLDEWHDKLGVFDDMLSTRRKAFAERLPEVRQRAGEVGFEALQKRRDAAVAETADGESAADGIAFADARQHELLARAASVREALKAGGDEAVLAPLRERVRLAAGVLGWQLAQDFPARLWEAKKELVNVDVQLADARQRDAALAEAQREEPARIERFATRIAAIDPLLQRMIPRVAALSREQQGVVQDIAVAELVQQKERLAAYATQARFAVAQLYDRANAGVAVNTRAGTDADGRGRRDAADAPRP
jgi:hypothetical protein